MRHYIFVFFALLSLAGCKPELQVVVSEGGKVQSTDGTIDCPSQCTRPLAAQDSITLTAVATLPGYVFDRWEGACLGTNNVCELTHLDAADVHSDTDMTNTDMTNNGMVLATTVHAFFKRETETLADVVFEDAKLANCLLNAYAGNTPASEVFYIDCDYQDIVSLQGIEHLASLHSVSVTGNRIADISPLANSMLLGSISVSYNAVVDASVLFNLPVLTWLDLSGNGSIDCVSVETMTEYLKAGRYEVVSTVPQCQ